MSQVAQAIDQLAHELGLFEPPLRAKALAPAIVLPGERSAAIWIARADDGRVAMFFALNLDDAIEWAKDLLPDAAQIECAKLRSEIGTPFM